MERTPQLAAELISKATGEDWSWMTHQDDVFDTWAQLSAGEVQSPKMLVMHPTGKGKTDVMLVCLWLLGVVKVVVVAPPSTHARWRRVAHVLGMQADCIAHATYRKPDYGVWSTDPYIVDEFHMLGKQSSQGWKKFDAHMRKTKAPVIGGSATPQYNDPERVYCVMHGLDAENNRGGFIGWLHRHCFTEENPHGSIPIVTGLRDFESPQEMLASLPYVAFLADESPDIVKDIELPAYTHEHFDDYHLDHRRERVMSSQMEIKHRRRLESILTVHGLFTDDVERELNKILDANKRVIVFLQHSEIAKQVHVLFQEAGLNAGYVDGDTTPTHKETVIELFRQGMFDILIGTATMATGTDGLDKVCDVMVILDDIEDDALREQLVGRVKPRGIVTPEDYERKVAWRFVFTE